MTVTTPAYTDRATVKRAMDVALTARMDAQIDRLIQASSRQIEQVTNRYFYPMVDTREFDWPINYSGSGGRPWQIFLDANEMISLTSAAAGPLTIPPGNINLEPRNYGPPFKWLEISLASSSSFSGSTTWQRAVAATGLYGFQNDEIAAGSVVGSLTSGQTTITVTDSSMISPGALIRIDSERMIVSNAAMVSTGVTFTGPLTASAADTQLDIGASVNVFAIDETILLDGERMLIVDIVGTKLVVKRVWDGSVLATHSNTLIYAPRLLTVLRGSLGTTAATHSVSAPINRHMVPAFIETVCTDLTLYGLGIEKGGVRPVPLVPAGAEAKQAKRSMSPVTAMLDDLNNNYGRKARTRAI